MSAFDFQTHGRLNETTREQDQDRVEQLRNICLRRLFLFFLKSEHLYCDVDDTLCLLICSGGQALCILEGLGVLDQEEEVKHRVRPVHDLVRDRLC